jgi:hypothetical protein
MQRTIVAAALELLEKAWAPRTTVQRPEVWDAEHDELWRARFMRVDDSNREALAEAGRERRNIQRQRKETQSADAAD